MTIQVTQQHNGPTLSHSSGGPDLLENNGPKPRCMWDETVCTEIPTHHITHPAVDEDEAVARTFCIRHYVLTLAEHVEVHTTQCNGTVENHFAAYGPLG